MPTARCVKANRDEEQRCHPPHTGLRRPRWKQPTIHLQKEQEIINKSVKIRLIPHSDLSRLIFELVRKLYQLTFLGILCVTASQKTTQANVKCNPETREEPGQHDAAADFSLDRHSLFHRPECFPLTPPKRIYVHNLHVQHSNSVRCRWAESAAPPLSV